MPLPPHLQLDHLPQLPLDQRPGRPRRPLPARLRRQCHVPRHLPAGLRRLPAATLVLAACSAAIELAQLVAGLAVAGYLYRVVDVDDVILNVAGGLIGFGLWKAWERLAAPKRDELV